MQAQGILVVLTAVYLGILIGVGIYVSRAPKTPRADF